MKIARNALIVCGFCILVVRCGPQPTIGTQSLPLSGPTRTDGASHVAGADSTVRARRPKARAEFLYVQEWHHIDALAIDRKTGALKKISGSPYHAPVAGLRGIIVDPAANQLYVSYGGVGDDAGGLYGYSIDPHNGTLQPAGNVGSYGSPYSMAITPNGGFFYAAQPVLSKNGGGFARGGVIVGYSIDSSTGALQEVSGSPFSTGGTAPDGIAITPSGSFLYATEGAKDSGFAGQVAGFSINSNSGALTKSPGNFAKGLSANSAVVAPSGKFLYLATSENGGAIYVYEIHVNGRLEETPGSPYGAPGRAYQMAITPSGKYVYATGANQLLAFSVNRRTGALKQVPGSPYASNGVISVAVDSTGKFLFAVAGTTLSSYKINARNGSLTAFNGVGGQYHNARQLVVAEPH